MLIKLPPMETTVESNICSYHKKNPGKAYAGCTCSGAITSTVKPLEDWTKEEREDYFRGYE